MPKAHRNIEILRGIGAKTKLSKSQTEKVYDVVFETIKKELEEKGAVWIPGFGTFKISWTKGRKHFHIWKKIQIDRPSTPTARFKPVRDFKLRLRSKLMKNNNHGSQETLFDRS